jgi:hypothetical protein
MLSFSHLWEHHPTNTGDQYPCQTNGVSNFANQCSIRMGVCLKRGGVLPGQIHGALTCSQATASGHSPDEMHFVRAHELAGALASAAIEGLAPHIKLNDPKNFADELNGRTGIIYFNGYWWREEDKTRPTGDHIDLWNGWRTTAKVLLPWFGWLGGYDAAAEMWFWEVR